MFQSDYKNDYVKLSREEKVVLMKQSQNNVTIDLTLQGQYITVQTNAPGATLYVNQNRLQRWQEKKLHGACSD